MLRSTWATLWLVLFGVPAYAGPVVDPLNSVMWEDMQQQFFANEPVVFDDRIKVIVPMVLEDQAQVPVTVDARALKGVKKLVVFADLNPLQHVLTLSPNKAEPFISFRMKVEQGTPVRAAALLPDGTWHVGGVFLDAAGGGCSSPATARNKPDWSLTVGQVRGRLWPRVDGSVRVRMKITHPMDTGLTQDNIPAFYVDTTRLRSASGEVLATLEMREPVSEDPTVTLFVKMPPSDAALSIESRDSDGNSFNATMPAPWRQSKLQDDNDTGATVVR